MRALILILAFAHLNAHAMDSVFAKEFGTRDRFDIVTSQALTSDANLASTPDLIYTNVFRNKSKSCALITQNGPRERMVIPAGSHLQVVKLGPLGYSKIYFDATSDDLVLVNAETGNEVGVVWCGSHGIWINNFNLTLNVTMSVLGATVVPPYTGIKTTLAK